MVLYMQDINHRQEGPAWRWLLATVFLFPILPEYISPFVLFAAFIVFKVQWSREGRKAKVGTLGKMIMAFMCLALLSVFWSDTALDTLGSAGLWWAVFLMLVMINNLADTRKKINDIIKAAVASAAANGILGTLQICSYSLCTAGYINSNFVIPTPIYKGLDKLVYTWLPFEISTHTFDDRASGFFSNPNLLATYLIFAYPLSVYMFLNAKTKSHRILYILFNLLISAGLSSTMTRAGCVIAIAGWVFMFIVLIKRHGKTLFKILIPTLMIIVPSLLMRYGLIAIPVPHSNGGAAASSEAAAAAAHAAKQSSANHFEIWQSAFDYITENARTFLIGLGFGCESTGNFLLEEYGLNKPHAHNFVLEIWAELGIIGIALLFAVIIKAVITLFKTKTPGGPRYDVIFYIFTSLGMYLGFGLTDYIFNSPKQIILLMMLIGLTQAINRCYEQNEPAYIDTGQFAESIPDTVGTT